MKAHYTHICDKYAPPKTDLNALKAKTEAVNTALDKFLETHNLTLSPQNRDRAFQHLLACMHEYDETLNAGDVRSYLDEVLAYHEYNIEMMNKTGIAEDSLIKILITADQDVPVENVIRPHVPRWKFSWRALPLPVAVSLVLLIGASLATPVLYSESRVQHSVIAPNLQVITRAEEEELRTLVEALSAKSGESHLKIYNRIKDLPEVLQYGYARSYKKFNHAQFTSAKMALEGWLAVE